MKLDMEGGRTVCYRCGTAYGQKKGNFAVCYAPLYKGSGYLPYCKTCVDTMYNDYLKQSNGDTKEAVHRMCRKLDLYWSETIYESTEKRATARSMMTGYIQRVNNIAYAGKCYDDSMSLFSTFGDDLAPEPVKQEPTVESADEGESALTMDDISEETIAYWGPGYSPDMYQNLEQRRTYWVNNLPGDVTPDVGMEALIRQICNLEIDIARLSASGRSADKQIGMLDKLVSSMNLKPVQKGEENSAFDKTPFGIWIDRWENKRPIPEPDEDLSDVDKIIKYITTWMLGHLCAMFGIKNKYCKLYEEAIDRYRIENNEVEEDDDEEFFNMIFSNGGESG